MNDRIFNIAEQVWGNVDVNSRDYKRREAFAQLIIDECIGLCNELGEDVDNGNIFMNDSNRQQRYKTRWSTGPFECAEMIKQHFMKGSCQ